MKSVMEKISQKKKSLKRIAYTVVAAGMLSINLTSIAMAQEDYPIIDRPLRYHQPITYRYVPSRELTDQEFDLMTKEEFDSYMVWYKRVKLRSNFPLNARPEIKKSCIKSDMKVSTPNQTCGTGG